MTWGKWSFKADKKGILDSKAKWITNRWSRACEITNLEELEGQAGNLPVLENWGFVLPDR